MTEPTLVERAQDWHDQQRTQHLQREEYSSCWCCCDICEAESPVVLAKSEALYRQ